MKTLGIAVFVVILLGVNATPACTYNPEQPYIQVCDSDGNDNVLMKGLVSNQDKVEQIFLYGCKITEIQCDAFSELPALTLLNIANNVLHELKPCVLNNLYKLTSLFVSNNKISVVPSDTFANLNNLQTLDLQGNLLKTLQPDVFDRLTNLSQLVLSNNAIDGKNLRPQIFANNAILRKLYLSGNNMSAAPEDLLQSFQILEILDLERCFLTRVPSFATKNNLKTLKHLELSKNSISSLDDPTAFINLENLEKLYLDYNLIENIVDYVFTSLRQLKYIFLDHNHLKTISDKLLQNMPKLVHIDLSYNDIEVINLDSFRNTPMEYLNLTGNRMSYMPVNFYETLIVSGGNLKKFNFNNNPWQCACLREILQEVKTHNLKYDSAAYDGKRPVCLNTDDDFRTCKRR